MITSEVVMLGMEKSLWSKSILITFLNSHLHNNMTILFVVAATIADVIIGGESRLTLHNTEIVAGKWIDDESWYWSGNGVRGCFGTEPYSQENCKLRVRFVGANIKIFGDLNGKGIRTHFYINDAEVYSAKIDGNDIAKKNLYFTTNVRADEIFEEQILDITIASDYTQSWSMQSDLRYQNYVSISHVVVDSRYWYPPEAFNLFINERGLQSAMLTRVPFSAAEVITTGLGDSRGQVFLDDLFYSYLTSGLSTSVSTEQPSHSLEIVFASHQNFTQIVKGAYVSPAKSGAAFSVNFGSTKSVAYDGVWYRSDPSQNSKSDFLNSGERFVTYYRPSYDTLWGDDHLSELMTTWKESREGEELVIPLEVKPGGRYLLHLTLGINLETSVSEENEYFNINVPSNDTESELRFFHKSKLTKASQTRCTIPVAARYFAEVSQTDLTVANVGSFPTTRFDPFIGSYCKSGCHSNWRVKYFCSPIVTLSVGEDVLLNEFELSRFTGGLHVPISIYKIIEIPSFKFSTQISITPQPGHVASIFGLSLREIGGK